MIKLELKPLSVNTAWQGRRYKTKEYEQYERNALLLLPDFKLPGPPYKLTIEFGFSNKASDIDNPLKTTLDILCKKYKFDDKDVYELNVKKVIVKKGAEYSQFKIEALK